MTETFNEYLDSDANMRKEVGDFIANATDKDLRKVRALVAFMRQGVPGDDVPPEWQTSAERQLRRLRNRRKRQK